MYFFKIRLHVGDMDWGAMSHGDQRRGVHQQGPAGHCQGQKPVPMGTNTFLLLKFGGEMSSSYSFTCLSD